MSERFTMESWARARDGVAVRYYLTGEEHQAVFVFGNDVFEFIFDAEVLGRFLKLGAEALARLGADPIPDQASACGADGVRPACAEDGRRRQ